MAKFLRRDFEMHYLVKKNCIMIKISMEAALNGSIHSHHWFE